MENKKVEVPDPQLALRDFYFCKIPHSTIKINAAHSFHWCR